MALDERERLKEILMPLRGRIKTAAPLAKFTRLRVGGAADVLFHPKDAADLQDALRRLPPHTELTVLGGGSNVLIRDGGIGGLVVRLSAAFAGLRLLEETPAFGLFEVGAAKSAPILAQELSVRGFGGTSFLSGIPGLMGGALCMNAGAFGGAMEDIAVKAFGFDRFGTAFAADLSKDSFGYRRGPTAAGGLFTHLWLRLPKEDPAILLENIAAIRRKRQQTQPYQAKTAGSTFMNPPDRKAWELIREVGGLELQIGAARFCPQHANFLLNEGGAAACDLEALGLEVQRRIEARFGLRLRWEVRRLGRPETEDPLPEKDDHKEPATKRPRPMP